MAKLKINLGTPDAPNWVVLDSKKATTISDGGYQMKYNSTSGNFEITYNGNVIGYLDNLGNLRIKGQIIEE